MKRMNLLVLAALALLISSCSHRIIVHDCKQVMDEEALFVCVKKAVP